MSLLAVTNIIKEYRNRVVLNNVSLKVQKGDRVALIGPNGAGKTTLLKIINGTEVPDSGTVIKAHGIKTGYLSQSADTDEIFSRHTALEYEKILRVEKRIEELEHRMSQEQSEEEYKRLLSEYQKALDLFQSLDGHKTEASLMKILNGLGLKKEVLRIPLANLSGGEKIRVALAWILLESPELLLLDEPTNHLDIDAVEWLENFLLSYGGGVLLVSHDRYFLDRVTTRIVELRGGMAAESKASSYTSYLNQKRSQQEFYQKERKKLVREIKETQKLIQDLKSRNQIGAYHSREKTLERLTRSLEQISEVSGQGPLKDGPGLKLKEVENVHVSAEIAYAKNLSKSYGPVKIFDRAEFLIRGGEKVGIVGPNGCGKTTLINILIGIDKDYQGTAVLGDWVKYAYLGQTVEFQNEDAAVWEEVAKTFDLDRKEALHILSDYGFFGNEADKSIRILSGGEKVRLKLALLLMNDPFCLIMDEPTNHLDADSRDRLEEMIADYKGTVIAVSHDRYFLSHCMNRILEIKDYRFVSYPDGYEQYSAERKRRTENGQDSKPQKESSSKNKKTDSADSKKDRQEEPDPEQQRFRKMEVLITEKENRLQELEEMMNKEYNPELFAEYGMLQKELEKLYEEL
jgi:ATP-binding cassette subfamily F protein 3